MADNTKYSLDELRGMYEQARNSNQRSREKDKNLQEDSGNNVLLIIIAASIVSIVAALGYDRSPQFAAEQQAPQVNQANVAPQPSANQPNVIAPAAPQPNQPNAIGQRQLPLYPPDQPIDPSYAAPAAPATLP